MLLKLLPQMLVDGLQLGFVYAIVALGYTMVYGVLHFINFANAEIFMCGAFIGAEVLIARSAQRRAADGRYLRSPWRCWRRWC